MNAMQKVVEAVTQKFSKPRVVAPWTDNPVHMRPVKTIMSVYAYKPKEVKAALDAALFDCSWRFGQRFAVPKKITAKYLGTLPKPVLHHMLGALSKFI